MINIALIGPGLIGKGVLLDLEDMNCFRVIGVCNSKRCIISSRDSIRLIDWENSENTNHEEITSDNILRIFFSNIINIRNLVIIDCTSSLDIAKMYPRWLQNGIHIITPNKKAFSDDILLWKSITESRYGMCYYESTVGAGLPIISTIRDLIETGDEIYRIEGIFSGTLSFIFNEFCNKNEYFSDIVKRTVELGYTEPDPRDDLNGIDIARKVLILSRLIGLEIELKDISVDNLIPESLENVSTIEEFMEKFDYTNLLFDWIKGEAIKENKVLRYVGVIDNINKRCEVKIEKYGMDHEFANTRGCGNIIAIYTRRFNNNPLIISGDGAGVNVTSFGILSDLLKIKRIIE